MHCHYSVVNRHAVKGFDGLYVLNVKPVYIFLSIKHNKNQLIFDHLAGRTIDNHMKVLSSCQELGFLFLMYKLIITLGPCCILVWHRKHKLSVSVQNTEKASTNYSSMRILKIFCTSTVLPSVDMHWQAAHSSEFRVT